MKFRFREEEEIDLLEVLKSPSRWFGLIYPYFFILMLLLGLYYVDSLDMIYINKASPALFDSVNIYRDISEIKAKPKAAASADMNDVLDPAPELISMGEKLYKSTCASCHGETGSGDGVAGSALDPKPRDFHSKDGWKNGRSFAAMYQTLQEGIRGSAMPAYEYLPARERIAMIQYIHTLAKDLPEATEADAKEMDRKFSLGWSAAVK